MENETKVIDINKYKSSVSNSPLLSGDAVEVKAYTASYNTTAKGVINTTIENKQPEVKKEPVFEQPPINQSQQKSDFYFKPPQNNQPPQPNFEQPDDNDFIDPMTTGEQPQKEEPEEEIPVRAAEANAAMMISMYSMMVPPIIADLVKTDVSKFSKVMSFNKHIPDADVQQLEKFLHVQNKEIEKALQLTKDQVMMLKQALAEVLRHYKVEPANPIVKLLIVIIGIAVTQFMSVRAIIAAQNEQLTLFIQHFGVKIPEGVENPLRNKKKLFVKKPAEMEQAA